MLKVVLVDDSVVIQRSFGRLLASVPGVELAGCARNGLEALDLISRSRPDVVVLDANLSHGEQGIDLLAVLAKRQPATQVIVLSNTAGAAMRASYLDAGALAYFDKSTEFMQARDWIAARCRGNDQGRR